MNRECILCRKSVDVSRPDSGKGEYFVVCETCGKFFYDHFFESTYISLANEKRAMISAYTRECFELSKDPPLLGDPDHLKDKLEEYKNKTIEEKLNNLLLYLRKKSNYLGDNVLWEVKKDYPITYSPNPEEFYRICVLGKERELLYLRSRDILELSSSGWEKAEELGKKLRMSIIERRFLFLKKLYEITKGDKNEIYDMWEIGKMLGFTNELTNKTGQYLEGENFIIFRTDQGEISISHEGIKEVEKIQAKSIEAAGKAEVYKNETVDPKKVFVVHGRNENARSALFDFLRSLSLAPIEWGEAVKMTGVGSPYPQEVLDKAFSVAQAIIVLITGDDIARLRLEYIKQDDKDYEKILTLQARPNVIFEAGLAFGRCPERTIIVELEREITRSFSDVYGRLSVRLSNRNESRYDLISRLKTAGCEININGKSDWIKTGDFDGAVIEYSINEEKVKKDEKIELNEEHYCLLNRIAGDKDAVSEEALFKNYKENYLQKERIDFNFILNDLKRLILIRHSSSFGHDKYYVMTDEGFQSIRKR